MSSSFDSSLTKIPGSLETSFSRKPNPGAQLKQDGSLPATSTSQDLQPYHITISEEALVKAGLLKDRSREENTTEPAKNSKSPVNTQETLELERLKQTDREVRAHEQAHVMAGGSLVRGAASFGYATGPDGRLYAVSGEVSIDSSPIQDDPEATIRKMQRVVAAALAPAQPSGQDRAVASSAIKTQVKAQQQVTQKNFEKTQDSGESESTNESEAQKTEPEKNAGVSLYTFNESSTGLSDKQGQSIPQVKQINIKA
jgi:hypothetical protein